jgi:hypothetical protein
MRQKEASIYSLKHHIKWGPHTKMMNKPYLKCLNISMLTPTMDFHKGKFSFEKYATISFNLEVNNQL